MERVDIIAHHQYGTIKHAQLGRAYNLHIQPFTQEHLNDIKDTLERHGLAVQLGG